MKHKTSVGFSSFSTRREEQDEDLVKVTTSFLELLNERVGSCRHDVESTTLTSLFKGRVGSTKDGTRIDHFNFTLQRKSGINRGLEMDQPLYQPMGCQVETYDNLLEAVSQE